MTYADLAAQLVTAEAAFEAAWTEFRQAERLVRRSRSRSRVAAFAAADARLEVATDDCHRIRALAERAFAREEREARFAPANAAAAAQGDLLAGLA